MEGGVLELGVESKLACAGCIGFRIHKGIFYEEFFGCLEGGWVNVSLGGSYAAYSFILP